jgi:hypothetical protein
MHGIWRVALLALGAAVMLGTPAADAKLGLSLAISPTPPVAGQRARVTLRARELVPDRHGLRLTVVGAWRSRLGQTVLDVPLARVGPRTLTATIRFPHAGRWTVVVPNEPSGRWFISVRPRG